MIQTIRGFFDKMSNLVDAQDIVMLWLRLWVATIFYKSGRTKVDEGYLELSETTVFLFEEEYQVPFLSPETAGQLAIYGETFLPLLLIFGLASRFAAAGLLVMTAVIQYVYPNLWADHIVWAAALVGILMVGPGKIALDHIAAKNIR